MAVEYNGSVSLISGLIPKNNGTFPLMRAQDVLMPDGSRLDVWCIPVGIEDEGKILQVKDGMWQAVAFEDSIIKQYIDELFAAGGGGTGGETTKKLDTPVIRIETVDDGGEPIVIKLATPVIRLEMDDGGGDDEGGDSGESTNQTPAILGVAVLGRTILGVTSLLPKIDAPSIELVVVDDTAEQKLDAPVIRLAIIEDGADPVATKLTAPVIRLETSDVADQTPAILGVALLGRTILGVTTADGGGSVKRLEAPVIRIETVKDGEEEPDEPEDPDVVKLNAPVIRLETVEDGGDEPDIPDEPEDPEVVKLDTPVIRLETVDDSGEDPTECAHSVYTSETRTEATCDSNGVITRTCSECGSTWTEDVAAVGHDYGDPYYSDEFVTGYGQKCNNCGELIELEAPMETLDAPVIYLELDAPLEKLDTPEIYMESIEGEESVVMKLETPYIYLGVAAPVITVSDQYNEDLLAVAPYVSANEVDGANHYKVTVTHEDGTIVNSCSVPTINFCLGLYLALWGVADGTYKVYAKAHAKSSLDRPDDADGAAQYNAEYSENSNEVTFTWTSP